MLAVHLLGEIDTKTRCVYCNRTLESNSWQSVFDGTLHYKTTKCKCSKENRIKVDFAGSGHDSWDGTFNWFKELTKSQKKEKQKVKRLEPLIKELKRVDKFVK